MVLLDPVMADVDVVLATVDGAPSGRKVRFGRRARSNVTAHAQGGAQNGISVRPPNNQAGEAQVRALHQGAPAPFHAAQVPSHAAHHLAASTAANRATEPWNVAHRKLRRSHSIHRRGRAQEEAALAEDVAAVQQAVGHP